MNKKNVIPVKVTLCPRGKLRHLFQLCLITSLTTPALVSAQQDVEEVVVTGSYIRNSAFAQNSPVDTVTQEDLQESGAPNISKYIRDTTYTQAADIVKNVLAPGGQSGVGSSFNLRGLSSNSTLMLIDGKRSLISNMNRNVPEISISRLEVVLDGDSATYGSDAVAGVVNELLEKDFEGFNARSYYQRTEDGAMEDFTNAAMWGGSFESGINYTGAFEFRKRTDLMGYERSREMDFSATTAPSGNLGSFKQVVGASDGVNMYGHHGGKLAGAILTDPSCETFNSGAPQHGQDAGAMPAKYRLASGQCAYEWSIHNPFGPASDDYSLYNTVSIEANDWLRVYESGHVSNEDEMEVLESVVTGDLYDLPSGTAQLATGNKYRDLWARRFADPNMTVHPGIQYNGSSYLSPVPEDETYRSEVHAVFTELQIPILETLDMRLVARHEDFKTFGLKATTLEVSLRWEALPTCLLIRHPGSSCC